MARRQGAAGSGTIRGTMEVNGIRIPTIIAENSAARCDGFCPLVFVMLRVAFFTTGCASAAFREAFGATFGAVFCAALPGFLADSG